MAAPYIDPPAGTQWIKHSNVELHGATAGEDVVFAGGLISQPYGWETTFEIEPTWTAPGVSGNDHYWFDRWYFANFRLYLGHVASGEVLAVQPDPLYEGPSAISGSPFSAGTNINVRQGNAWVSIDTSIGAGPMWPPILHVTFTEPKWGVDQFGAIVTATPNSSAGLIQWRGDVWTAEPLGSTAGPPPPGPQPTVLAATARPSATAPQFKVVWPHQGPAEEHAGHVPGEISELTIPRVGFVARRLVMYEVMEHWRPPQGDLTATVLERAFTFVKVAGAEDVVAVWDGDNMNWDERVWGA
jgi:hypothetical protein